MKKKLVSVLLTGMMVFSLTACAGGGNEETSEETTQEETSEDTGETDELGETEIQVFIAASLNTVMEELAEKYNETQPNVTITFNADSSGTLLTQIQEGYECDIFFSAAQKQMDELDIAVDADKNPDRLDFVDDATRVDLLENQVVLVVPEGNPKNIQSFSDIASRSELIALGNSDVPVGQYSEEILRNLGLWDALNAAGKITYGSNVKEVTTQVAEGVADCGIVYATDAFSAGLMAVDEATEDLCGQVIYPAAVMKHRAHKEQATAFLEYLQTDAASEIFESVGFHPLTE